MKGQDLTEKQLKAAEQYLIVRRADGCISRPHPDQNVVLPMKQLIMLIAEYGAIRAKSMLNGGSVDEPGEVYKTTLPPPLSSPPLKQG